MIQGVSHQAGQPPDQQDVGRAVARQVQPSRHDRQSQGEAGSLATRGLRLSDDGCQIAGQFGERQQGLGARIAVREAVTAAAAEAPPAIEEDGDLLFAD